MVDASNFNFIYQQIIIRYMSGSNFGMMDEGYFVSKSEIFKWIEASIGKGIKSIEQLGTGAVYCELMNKHCEGKEAILGIITQPKLEHEYVHNLKLFQRAIDKLKTDKKLDILKMSKCKYADNLEIIQWLKRFLEAQSGKMHLTQFTSTNRLNSPKLFTSPNLRKKMENNLSPRGMLSPKLGNMRQISEVMNNKWDVRHTSPSSKLSDIKNLLKSNQKSEEEKLKIIKQLVQKVEMPSEQKQRLTVEQEDDIL